MDKSEYKLSTDLEVITEFVSQFYHFNFLKEKTAYHMLRDSLSYGQLLSKMQVINLMQKLNIKSNKCIFLAHWHGLLPFVLKKYDLIQSAIGFEIDQESIDFSHSLNHKWIWKSFNKSIFDVNYEDLDSFNDFDLLINTSCEHTNSEWIGRVPSGRMVILQSTNYTHEQHTNRVNNLDEFAGQFSSLKVIERTEIDCLVYKRFTLVGETL